MGDVVGRLFHEFAMTLAVTIILSAVVSLTLVPMMCARLLHEHDTKHAEPAWSAAIERWTVATIEGYGRALDVVLRHRRLTLGVFGATLMLTGVLAVIIPKGSSPCRIRA